jgi:hypothetical protein
MIQIETSFHRLEYQLARLALAAKVDLGLVIKEEAKYAIQTIVKFTPPKNKQQGVNAVRADFSRLAQPLVYSDLEAKATEGGFYKSMARYVRNRKVEKMRALLRNPNLTGYYGMRLLENQDALKKEHKTRGNNRGRITGKATALAFGSDFKKYRNEIEGRVGWTVSGWNSSAKVAGARYKRFSDKLKPQSGLNGRLFGYVSSSFGERPFIKATASHVKIPNYQRMIDGAINSRERTTIKKVNAVLANRAVNLGFTKVNGAMPLEQLKLAA